MINNKIEKDMLITTFPHNEYVYNNKLNKEDMTVYLKLYNAYRELLTNYLINNMKLFEYDKKIKESNLNFKVVKKEKMDIYQFFSASQLSYFYIRNNIYIERLDNKEKEILLNKIQSRNYNIDKNIEDFLEQTYKKVIMEDALKNGKECIICFGPDSSKFMAKNNNIVIGFRFDDFYNIKNRKDFSNEYKKQLIFIDNLFRKMESNCDNNVTIIKYNDFCVKKCL